VAERTFDYTKGKRRFKSDLIPAPILIARYFIAERDAIEALRPQLADVEQQLQEMMEETAAKKGCWQRSLKAKATSRRSPPNLSKPG
jgi:type I restriction enzyme M protein